MEIDFVYLWVNGNDPKWLAKKNAFLGIVDSTPDNCKARFSDRGELRYSLRSLELYAPWIRRIFIVTDNQVPEWLDTTNPKVQIVDHTEIMPSECLPCYNSALIEQFLHNIPGLSEHFLYANDDMFFNRPVQPQDFFTPDGRPFIFMHRRPFRKLVIWYRQNIKHKPFSTYLITIRNSSRLVEKAYGKYYGCKPHHNIDAYTRSMFTLVNEKFKEELSTMRSHHIRSVDDYQRCLYSYVALAEKIGKMYYISSKHSMRVQIYKHQLYQKLQRKNPMLFCVNDSELANDDDREIAAKYLNKKFPKPSQFEK